MKTWIPAQEWTATRHHKPDDFREVLGVVHFADDAPYIDIVKYDQRDKSWFAANGMEKVRVTYWCELPPLPKR